MKPVYLFTGAVVAAAGYLAWKKWQPAPAGMPASGGVLSDFVLISQKVGIVPFSVALKVSANQPYITYIRDVETALGIPRNLLVRLAYQESSFNPRAYNKKVGASGMFQIVPRWHPGVDVWNWKASADYAGRYLVKLFKRFGTWKLALAAYNWGQGNLAKYGIAAAPAETRNYYTRILADVGINPVYA